MSERTFSRAFPTGSHEIYQAIEAANKNIEAVGFKNFDYYFELSGVVATGTTSNLAWPFDESSLDEYHMEVGLYFFIQHFNDKLSTPLLEIIGKQVWMGYEC